MRFFLFLHGKELWLVSDPTQVAKPRELLLQNSDIDYLRAKSKEYLTWYHCDGIIDKVTRKRTRLHTPDSLARIRAAKMGDKNPNAKGLSETHRKKISKALRGTWRGERNPMYNRRHSWVSRQRLAFAASQIPRRWCVEPSGKTHYVDMRTFILPENWQWGRFFDPYK